MEVEDDDDPPGLCFGVPCADVGIFAPESVCCSSEMALSSSLRVSLTADGRRCVDIFTVVVNTRGKSPALLEDMLRP